MRAMTHVCAIHNTLHCQSQCLQLQLVSMSLELYIVVYVCTRTSNVHAKHELFESDNKLNYTKQNRKFYKGPPHDAVTAAMNSLVERWREKETNTKTDVTKRKLPTWLNGKTMSRPRVSKASHMWNWHRKSYRTEKMGCGTCWDLQIIYSVFLCVHRCLSTVGLFLLKPPPILPSPSLPETSLPSNCLPIPPPPEILERALPIAHGWW